MSAKVRYLTKSRFKIGSSCARKLNYNDDPTYGNNKETDQFLKALAEGGFQVGELAKLYHPGGIDLSDIKKNDEALRLTDEALKCDIVTIYEAALKFGHTFIRVDVLEKRGETIRLTEVKAKSFDGDVVNPFTKTSVKNGEYALDSEWGPYFLDIAFQTWVARRALPTFKIEPYLMLADTSKSATIDGVHQKFLISRADDGQSRVSVKGGVTLSDLGDQILTSFPVLDSVDHIIFDTKHDGYASFDEMVTTLSEIMLENKRAAAATGSHCKKCEFRIKDGVDGKRSGYQECWKEDRGLKDSDFDRQFVYDIWDMKSAGRLMDQERIIFSSELDEKDLQGKTKPKKNEKAGHSRVERQYFQVELEGKEKQLAGDLTELAKELSALEYPLHFIDFETAMVAIPFFKGYTPYSQHAYQFSHHILHKDGKLEHRTEYLDARIGQFPNFDFVRALRNAIPDDGGSVLRFAPHENTVLNQIRRQLIGSQESDKATLIDWIESLTTPGDKEVGAWKPKRVFVDMLDIYKRHTYLSDTKGSNSIKRVLPAVLRRSGKVLSEKFPDWVQFDSSGETIDPYKLLPPTWGATVPDKEVQKFQERLIRDESLNQGGAALIAWSRMQFTEMSSEEREALAKALLRYCQLDTIAMVMIWEWWQHEIQMAEER